MESISLSPQDGSLGNWSEDDSIWGLECVTAGHVMVFLVSWSRYSAGAETSDADFVVSGSVRDCDMAARFLDDAEVPSAVLDSADSASLGLFILCGAWGC
jgi:hypothetical protein